LYIAQRTQTQGSVSKSVVQDNCTCQRRIFCTGVCASNGTAAIFWLWCC